MKEKFTLLTKGSLTFGLLIGFLLLFPGIFEQVAHAGVDPNCPGNAVEYKEEQKDKSCTKKTVDSQQIFCCKDIPNRVAAVKKMEEKQIYALNANGILEPVSLAYATTGGAPTTENGYRIGKNGIEPFEGIKGTGDSTITRYLKATLAAISGTPYVTVGETQAGNAYIDNVYSTPGVTGEIVMATGSLYRNPPMESASVWAMKTYDGIEQKINPVKSVYAANQSTVYNPGWGTQMIESTKKPWDILRNFGYMLLIIIVVIDAFLILFRQKLSGKEAVTLMNSIPSIILAIIMMTFSYPISGMFIDVITVGANLVQSILVSTPGSPGYETVWKAKINYSNSQMPLFELPTKTPWSAAETDAPTAIQIDDPYVSVWTVFGTADLDPFRTSEKTAEGISIVPVEGLIRGGPITAVVGSFGQVLEGSGMAGGFPTAATAILSLIFAFAALTASVQTFFKLLTAYLTLILYPMVSPLLFLMVAIPSLTTSIIWDYLRTMLAAALSFVAVYAVFLTIIVISYDQTSFHNFAFVPPLLGYGGGGSATDLSNPDAVGFSGRLVQILIGYGLFLTTPMIPDMIKNMLSVGSSKMFGEIQKSTQAAGGQVMNLGNTLLNAYKSKTYPKDK